MDEGSRVRRLGQLIHELLLPRFEAEQLVSEGAGRYTVCDGDAEAFLFELRAPRLLRARLSSR